MSEAAIRSAGKATLKRWFPRKRRLKGMYGAAFVAFRTICRLMRGPCRMRKWRAENREKNRQNDLRCRVYRLARQKFGEHDSPEKQQFVRDEITRRLGRRLLLEQQKAQQQQQQQHEQHQKSAAAASNSSPSQLHAPSWRKSNHHQKIKDRSNNANSHAQQHRRQQPNKLVELPFYSAPQQKIELPSISLERGPYGSSSPSPVLPHLSPSWKSERRVSNSSISTLSSSASDLMQYKSSPSPTETSADDDFVGSDLLVLPPMHSLLSCAPNAFTANNLQSYNATNDAQVPEPSKQVSDTNASGVRYVDQTGILDEFVGVVLDYAMSS